MKRLSSHFLALIILAASGQLLAKPRIAVIPFNNTGKALTKAEVKYLTERVRTNLIKTNRFEVISNDQLKTMMKTKAIKQKLGKGSCTTDSCVIDLGNALECEKMLVGDAASGFGQYTISAKIVDVVAQRYDKAEEVTIKDKERFPWAAKTLVRKLTGYATTSAPPPRRKSNPNRFAMRKPYKNYGTMIWLSMLYPGVGHIYAGQSRGWLYGTAFTVSALVFMVKALDYSVKRTDYSTATDDFDAKYDASQEAKKSRSTWSYVTVGVWAWTLIDILIFGPGYTNAMTLLEQPKIRQPMFQWRLGSTTSAAYGTDLSLSLERRF